MKNPFHKVLGKCVNCKLDVDNDDTYTKFLSHPAVYDRNDYGWRYCYIHHHCIHNVVYERDWYKEVCSRLHKDGWKEESDAQKP